MAVENRAVNIADRELTITRVFDAPRELVFKAWTRPEHLANWWGPRGFTLPEHTMDFRPGGAYRFRMRPPEGGDVFWYGVYREIVPPERLVWTCSIDDADGKPISSETVLTVTFEEHNDKTKLTLRQAVFDSVANRDSHNGGWSDALDRLAMHVARMD